MEDERLRNLPPKRNASEFEAAVARPSKFRKKSESKSYNYDRVTAIDWHTGETPLFAWLNQSAMPAIIPNEALHEDLNMLEDGNLIYQEKKEIEVYKYVHVAPPLEPKTRHQLSASPELGLDLELGAQIYYRNIMDRFPALPVFLARRFANANLSRAKKITGRPHQELSYNCTHPDCHTKTAKYATMSEWK